MRFTSIKALSTALLLAALSATVAGQEPASNSSAAAASPSPTPSVATNATLATPAPVLSTFTSTLTLNSGQSLPTSLATSASRNGSVYYFPIVTTLPASTTTSVPANATETGAAASAAASKDRLLLHTIIDPAFGVLGAILIISGLPMTFYGHRNRWSSYFIAGFYSLALITISIILKVGVEQAINPPSKGVRGLFLLACIVAGAVGGVLSIVFWKGAALLASGLGGFALGLFLQAVRAGGLIAPIGLRYILYVGLFAVFFALSCAERIHSLVLAAATAIAGATAVTLGIDCYSTQGLKEFYIRNLGFDSLFQPKYPATFQNGGFPLVQGMQIELGVLGALVVMGMAFQLRLWSDLKRNAKALKKSDEKRNMRSKAERAARAVSRSAKRDLAEWEKRHGYKKTAGRKGDADPEKQETTSSDATPRHERKISLLSLMGKKSEELPYTEDTVSVDAKRVESPGGSSSLYNDSCAFPTNPGNFRTSSFLSYIQRGPVKLPEDGPPKLELDGILAKPPLHGESSSKPATPTSPIDEQRKILAEISTIRRSIEMLRSGGSSNSGTEARPLTPASGFYPSGRITPSGMSNAGHSAISMDLARTVTNPAEPSFAQSFRQRSASTAALLEGSASFLGKDSPPSQSAANMHAHVSSQDTSDSRQGSLRAFKASLPPSLDAPYTSSQQSHDILRSYAPSTHISSAPASAWMPDSQPMTRSTSDQQPMTVPISPMTAPVHMRFDSSPASPTSLNHVAPAQALSPANTSEMDRSKAAYGPERRKSSASALNALESFPEDEGVSPRIRSKSAAQMTSHIRTLSGTQTQGPSQASLAARRALAKSRDNTPSNPWTNPGAEAARESSASLSQRKSMTIEELDARHRAKLAAMQRPVTDNVKEAEALQRAKEEWERKQKYEKRRMLEKEKEKMAALAAWSGATPRIASTSSNSAAANADRRRSRRLSAHLLEAVGEENKDRISKAAEWRQSISNVPQVDPATAKAARASSKAKEDEISRSKSSASAMSGNPFPSQAPVKRELTETDRRRLSQGAARRMSQPLLDFAVPTPGDGATTKQ